MRFKPLILISAIVVLMAFSTYAFIDLPQTSFNISPENLDKSRLFFYDDFDDLNGTGIMNTTRWPTVYGNSVLDYNTVSGTGVESYLNVTAAAGFTYGRVSNTPSPPNTCIDTRFLKKSGSAAGDNLFIGRGSTGGGADSSVRMVEAGDFTITGLNEDEIGMFIGGEASRHGTGFTNNDTYFTNVTLVINDDNTSQIFINNQYTGNFNSSYLPLAAGNQIFAVRDDDRFLIDYIYVYNCSTGFPRLIEANAPPDVTVSIPVNGSKTQDVPVNFTVLVSDDTSLTVNCTLNNETFIYDSIDDQAVDVEFNMTLINDYDQSYTEDFNITCIDDEGLSDSEIITLTIDTFTPIVTMNAPAVNGSTIFGVYDFDISCFDGNIWILNYTLKNTTNTTRSFQNDTNSSAADSGTLTIRDSFNTSTLSDGSYQLDIACSDSHTKRLIPDYGVSINLPQKMITFTTDDGNIVSITLLNGNINKLEAIKNTDRYNFNFDLEIKSRKKYKFHLGTLDPLILMDPSTGHFISGNNWIDFVNDNLEAEIWIEKINDHEYYIEIQTDDLYFKSIGGLNINEFFYDLTIDNSVPAIEGETVDRGVYDSIFKNIFILLISILMLLAFIGFGIFTLNESMAGKIDLKETVIRFIGLVIGLIFIAFLIGVLFSI